MKKTHVLFINYSLDVGGIETLILEICRKMDRLKYQPFVCSFFESGKLKGEFEKIDVPVLTAPKTLSLDWKLPFRLAAFMRELDIDVVHTHNPSVWLYGGIAAKLAGLPLVHTAHSPSDYHSERWNYIEHLLSYFTQKIVPVSNYVGRYMIKEEGISAQKVRVIYNGVKADEFSVKIDGAEQRKQLGLSAEDFVYLIVARLTPVKDHATLLSAFKKVKAASPRAKLLIAGEGPLDAPLKAQAKELGLGDSVRFLGNRRDIAQLHRAANVFVLSSVKEGMPIVLLEAMASKLPVVVTNGGGSPEIVLDRKTGLVVPSQNPDAMAAALSWMEKNPAEAGQMGERGRDRVLEQFTFEKMVNAYYSVYDEAMGS